MAEANLPALAAMVALVVLALVAAVGAAVYQTAYGPRARLKRRMAVVLAVAGGRRGLAVAKGGSGAAQKKRQHIQSKLKSAEQVRAKTAGAVMRQHLTQADIDLSVRQVLAGCVVSGLAAAGLGVASAQPPAMVAGLALVFGLGLPRLVVSVRASRRKKKFLTLFADAIDVIVRGIRSGLPVGECFLMIAREMPDPVGAEFKQVVEGQRLGLTLDEALAKSVERMPTPELKFFAIVLSIQQQTGGNLAETLAKLSDVLRGRKKMRDKVQAMSGEAKSSAAIIGSLPIIVAALLSLIAWDYIGVLFTSDTGHVVIALGLAIMGLGIVVMRQMINFDM